MSCQCHHANALRFFCRRDFCHYPNLMRVNRVMLVVISLKTSSTVDSLFSRLSKVTRTLTTEAFVFVEFILI